MRFHNPTPEHADRNARRARERLRGCCSTYGSTAESRAAHARASEARTSSAARFASTAPQATPSEVVAVASAHCVVGVAGVVILDKGERCSSTAAPQVEVADASVLQEAPTVSQEDRVRVVSPTRPPNTASASVPPVGLRPGPWR